MVFIVISGDDVWGDRHGLRHNVRLASCGVGFLDKLFNELSSMAWWNEVELSFAIAVVVVGGEVNHEVVVWSDANLRKV